MNNLKTVALLSVMSALVWFIGIGIFGGTGGFYIGLLLRSASTSSPTSSRTRWRCGRAAPRPVEEHELPTVYSIIRRLAATADMPMPRIYMIDSPQPNAFATGRNPKHAAVAVTTGIMEIMSTDELEGVLAHELSHVKNRDILISSIAAMMAAALSIFARMAFWFGGGRNRGNALGGIIGLAALILAPLAGMVIRTADLPFSGVRGRCVRRGDDRVTAEPRLGAGEDGAATARVPMQVDPAVSQLFIDDPLKAFGNRDRRGGGNLRRWFSTHPPVEERVRRLTDMYYNV